MLFKVLRSIIVLQNQCHPLHSSNSQLVGTYITTASIFNLCLFFLCCRLYICTFSLFVVVYICILSLFALSLHLSLCRFILCICPSVWLNAWLSFCLPLTSLMDSFSFFQVSYTKGQTTIVSNDLIKGPLKVLWIALYTLNLLLCANSALCIVYCLCGHSYVNT